MKVDEHRSFVGSNEKKKRKQIKIGLETTEKEIFFFKNKIRLSLL